MLAAAARGDELPSLPLALAYVTVCGGDRGEWEARWRETARALEELKAARVVDDRPAWDAPYRGLARFEPGDRDLFFGREQLLFRLTGLLAEHRLVLLAGASGSGKSSLLRAGLIPVLQDPANRPVDCVAIRVITPGSRPAATHAHVLVPASGTPGEAVAVPEAAGAAEARAGGGGGDTVVVVDQFEEVFTLCQDADERARFVGLLLAAQAPDSRLRVVIGVRADFYGHCTGHPGLVEVLRTAHLALGPMTAADLRQAVVGPARAAGLIVERELTARIVEETAAEPGGLPLMSHALLEVWRRRRGRTLTLAAYEAIGGIHGAVADTAEHTYNQLTPQQADHARRIMLRLITPGQGAQDTRRPAPRTELEAAAPQETATVLEHLTRARLITLDDDTADLAHEALITAWPRLRTWIDEERTRLIVHRRLTTDTATWTELDHDPGALYRGTRLATAQDAFPRPHHDLTPTEHAFLTAATTAQDEEQQARARTTRRLRRSTAGLSVLLTLSLLASLTAWHQNRTSTRERDRARASERTAHSRQLAAESASLFEGDPKQATRLAVQAHHTAATAEAVGNLYRAATLPLRTERSASVEAGFDGRPRRIFSSRAAAISPDLRTVAFSQDGHKTVLLGTVSGDRTLNHSAPKRSEAASVLSYSPDGTTLAGNIGPRVLLRDALSGKLRATFTGHRKDVTALAYSPDGHVLATGDTQGVIRLWDIRSGSARTLAGHSNAIHTVTFAPDGTTLASSAKDGTVRLWNTTTGSHRMLTRKAQGIDQTAEPEYDGHRLPLHTSLIGFSPDGETLAVSQRDGTVGLWAIATRTLRRVLVGHRGQVRRVHFSPDGKTLATTDDQDTTIRLWDLAKGAVHTTLTAYFDLISALAFSKDSSVLVTVDRLGIRQWASSHPVRRTLRSGHATGIVSMDFAQDGRTLATAFGTEGPRDPFLRLLSKHTLHIWNLPSHRRRLTINDVMAPFDLSPDGMAIATSSSDGSVDLRETRTGRTRLTIPAEVRDAPSDQPFVQALAFSPDGTILAIAGSDRTMLLNTHTGKPLRTINTRNVAVSSLAFSPDGASLVVMNSDGAEVQLRDVATGKLRGTLGTGQHDSDRLPLSSDGLLAAGAGSGSVRLWNTTTFKEHRTITSLDGTVSSVAFSPDGRTLATAGTTGSRIRLWDTETGTLRQTLSDSSKRFLSLAFSSDTPTLAVGISDGTVQFWNTDLPDKRTAVTRLCQAIYDPSIPERHRGPRRPGCPQLRMPPAPFPTQSRNNRTAHDPRRRTPRRPVADLRAVTATIATSAAPSCCPGPGIPERRDA
ncbi:nSTAND1 domain-containing NTPase [Streptomyces clavuligerus]|nr:hypothetical protein [Streptomyces clavuligerus]WDN57595.1 hypothetical protein LL058_32385 [Streptomyces clavuligerus]